MTWRLAKSLETLRKQINEASPNRSKISDGTIGDAAHASRSSDHNPWVKDGKTGVVTALDITHDPAHGVDIQKLADAIATSKDSRVKYIICNGRIMSGSNQAHPAWQWRKYSGANPHNKHVHISVKSNKSNYDSTRNWAVMSVTSFQSTTPERPGRPLLKRGDTGSHVETLQELLQIHVDGKFGPSTETAVRQFQAAHRLVVDGKVGAYTWEVLFTIERPKAKPAPSKKGFWAQLFEALFGGFNAKR